MNIMLFDEAGQADRLPPHDRRTVHIRKVLRLGVGDELDVGVVNGPRGRATVVADDSDGVALEVDWGGSVDEPAPVSLLVGLPRPQTARKILRDCTTLGVRSIDFFRAEKGDPSYGQSALWSSGEWERQLVLGAEQAAVTFVPPVEHHRTLKAGMAALCRRHEGAARLALDVYEGSARLSEAALSADEAIVVIGPERGWSELELKLLGAWSFDLFHLGPRVLRSETAAVAAVTLVLARMDHL